MSRHAKALIALTIISLGLRLLLVEYHHFPFTSPWGGEMVSVASALSEGRGFSDPFGEHTGPTAWVPPAYPYLLAGIFAIFGDHTKESGMVAMRLNACFSAAIIPLLYFIGRRTFSPLAGILAAGAWAFYPLTGHTEAIYVWNTSLYALLLAAMALLAIHANRWAGLVCGLAVLVDTSAIASVAVVIGWLCWRHHYRLALATTIVCAAINLPWAARNMAVFDQVMLRSNLGFQLNYQAQEERTGKPHSHPYRNSSEMSLYKALGEVGFNRAKMLMAVEYIKASPAAYVRQSLARCWSFWTGNAELDYLYLPVNRWRPLKRLLYVLPFVLALVGIVALIRARAPEGYIFAGILLLQPLIYYFTLAMPRYRSPIEPFLCVLAGIAAAAVLQAQRCDLPFLDQENGQNL